MKIHTIATEELLTGWLRVELRASGGNVRRESLAEAGGGSDTWKPVCAVRPQSLGAAVETHVGRGARVGAGNPSPAAHRPVGALHGPPAHVGPCEVGASSEGSGRLGEAGRGQGNPESARPQLPGPQPGSGRSGL